MGQVESRFVFPSLIVASVVAGIAAVSAHTASASFVLGCIVLLLITAGLVYPICRQEKSGKPSNESSVELTAQESTLIFSQLTPAVSTATIYTGSADAAVQHLQARVAMVVRLNPWLRGRLVRRSAGQRIQLCFDASAACDSGPEFQTLDVPANAFDNPVADYTQLVQQFQPFCVAKNGACIMSSATAATAAPALFRVTLLREREGGAATVQRFAVCVSLCHLLGDGHTFYALYGMLSGDGAPAALLPGRPANLGAIAADILGGNDCQDWIMASPGSFARVARTLLCSRRRPRPVFLPVPQEWVAAQKAAAAAAAAAGTGVSTLVVSTNDVLTSRLMVGSGCTDLAMAVNLRGREPSFTSSHAGNFEYPVCYQAGDFESPALIRRSLGAPVSALRKSGASAVSSSSPTQARVRRVHGDVPLPGFLQTALGRGCVVTNWSSFYVDLVLPGAVQRRHFPVFDAADASPIEEARIIFRPTVRELEVLAFTRRSDLAL